MSKRIITLGTWDGKPSEWMIVRETDKTMLLFSAHVLSYGNKFDKSNSHNNWKKSDIRKFLADKFNTLFTNEEKLLIVNCCLTDCDNSKDDIFLLSVEEAQTYLTQEERKNIDKDEWYWLRSPSPYKSNTVAYIWADGRINDNHVKGCSAESGCSGSCGVRPAMWIRKD